MAERSVTQWSSLAREASAKYGVPASVLLALIQTETDGNPGETSSTGARGITQFEPGTARSYGVNTSPGHERSQIFGAAHYLVDLGYHRDPAHALASYNAGPGNPSAGAGYARTVIARAKQYTSYDRGSSSSAPARPQTSSAGSPSRASGSNSGVSPEHRSQILKWALEVAVVAAGGLLAYRGLRLATGAHLPSVPTPARTGRGAGAGGEGAAAKAAVVA